MNVVQIKDDEELFRGVPIKKTVFLLDRIEKMVQKEEEGEDDEDPNDFPWFLTIGGLAGAAGLAGVAAALLQKLDAITEDQGGVIEIIKDASQTLWDQIRKLSGEVLGTPEPPDTDVVIEQPSKAAGPQIDLSKVDVSIAQAIAEASEISGLPQYALYAIANKESALGTNTVSKTSSARGLFQPLRSTFNETVDKYGKQYGIDKTMHEQHRANAIMSALYLRDLAKRYMASTGKKGLSVTELYILHFRGYSGGKAFLKRYEEEPDQPAYIDSPTAAAANVGVYYRRGPRGELIPRSNAEVYEYFNQTVEQVGASLAQNPGLRPRATETAPPVVQQQTKPVLSAPPNIPTNTAPVPQRAEALPVVPRARTPEPTPAPQKSSFLLTPDPTNIPQDAYRTRNGVVVALPS